MHTLEVKGAFCAASLLAICSVGWVAVAADGVEEDAHVGAS